MASTVVLAEATNTDVDAAPVSKAAKTRLRACGVTHLTPVQEKTLNAVIVDSTDVLVQAPTGSGKTLAYLLPLAHALELEQDRLRLAVRANDFERAQSADSRCEVAGVIFLPTRELASQVFHHAERHVGAAGFVCILCVGGLDEKNAVAALKKKTDRLKLVVGTPGRIKEFFDRGLLNTKYLLFQVLDECDRLMDGGFENDVQAVCAAPGGKTRTVCLSATMPPGLVRFLQKRLPKNHARVSLTNLLGGNVGGTVEHLVFVCATHDVLGAVVCAVDHYADGGEYGDGDGDGGCVSAGGTENAEGAEKGAFQKKETTKNAKGQTIVFVSTKVAAERLAGRLAIAYEERCALVVTDTEEYARANKSGGTPVPKNINHKKRFVTSLHGDLPQTARDAAIASLRAGECDVLVATDVAARGLDLPGVELVVHADLPKDADAYAHRAGRAGRVGCLKKGVSLVLSATGSAAAEATSALEAGAKIRLRRLSCIGERVVTERSVAAVQAAWEAAAGRTNLTEGGESFESQSKPRDSKNAVALTEASLARLGERSLMNDRFDELSVDLASIRGKQKGGNAGKGRGQGKR